MPLNFQAGSPFGIETRMKSIYVRLTTFVWGLFIGFAQNPQAAVRVAVSLDPPQDNNAAIIAPTLEALRRHFGSGGLQVVELKLPDLERALRDRDVDVFLSTSGLSRRMAQVGARDLVTLASDRFPDPNRAYGSVFVVRADSDIHTFEDMRGKTLAANMPGGFYGYQIALGEIIRRGWDHNKFFAATEFFGRDLHHVVDAVLSGRADVGTLSSCFLEDTYVEDGPERKGLRAIGVVDDAPAPCLRSTELYPNWSFSTMPSTPAEISREVALALLAIPPVEGGLKWSIATDFTPTDELFKQLKLGPYDFLNRWHLNEFMRLYGNWILAVTVILILLLLNILILSALIKRRTWALSLALERERELKASAQQAADKLSALQRVGLIAQMSTMIAHELRQPITTMLAYIHGAQRRLEKGDLREDSTRDVLFKIQRQATKAEEIVSRVRSYARSKGLQKQVSRLEEVLRRAAETFQKSGRFTEAFECRFAKEPAIVLGSEIELELAVSNLLRNAAEALNTKKSKESRIILRLSVDQEQATIAVEDNGPVLSAEERQSLNIPLHSRKIEGIGLGLSIVSSIAAGHGGSLEIVEKSSGGICALISLPLLKEPQLCQTAEKH